MFKPFALGTLDGFEPGSGYASAPTAVLNFTPDVGGALAVAPGRWSSSKTASPAAFLGAVRRLHLAQALSPTYSSELGLSEEVARSLDAQHKQLLELQAGWDGYGAAPLRHETIAMLLADLRIALEGIACRPADLIPGGDGSIQAEWRTASIQLEYRVEEDGSRYAWVKERVTGREHEYFNTTAQGGLAKWAPRLA